MSSSESTAANAMLDRPRVLVLATTFPARPEDGTPAFVATLARSLQDEFEFTVLVPRVRGSVPSERIDRVNIRRFPYFPRRFEALADGAILANLQAQPWRIVEVPCLFASFWFHAVRTARRERPSLIHAHWLLPAGLVAMGLSYLSGIPYVATAHGADVFALRGRIATLQRRAVMRRASATVPTSREIGRALGFTDAQAMERAVPMGVDVQRIDSAVGPRDPQHGRFLFVGRLEEKKGLDILLAALRHEPGATLVVIGEGRDAERLRTFARTLGVADRVTWLGRQGWGRVMQELRSAYALVVPSKVASNGDSETTPLVMSEAMAAEVPVIASRLGGLAEQVVDDQTGLLFEAGSPASLAGRLHRAMADPDLLAACALAGRSAMIGSLDLETTSRRYRSIYRRAIERKLTDAAVQEGS